MHGGGELVVGGGPPIEGLIHGWIYSDTHGRGPYGFMIEVDEGRELVAALRSAAAERKRIAIYGGALLVSFGQGLAHLWFYARDEDCPERVCHLYEGAIEVAAEALAEACADSAERDERWRWRQARRNGSPLRALEREVA
jgi:hypothetical protein